MRTNGIVRKVDRLGRVVIPREYRKLHKIAIGDPMEITCLESGEIVLKKMDMSLELEEISSQALRVLSEETGCDFIVSSTEQWLSGYGKAKNSFVGRNIPKAMKEKLENREQFVMSDLRDYMPDNENLTLCVFPIAGDCDVFGSIGALCQPDMCDKLQLVIRTTALVIGNSLQKF